MRVLCVLGIIGLMGCRSDGEDKEEAVNQAPTISAVSISPSSGITTSASLSCEATAEDADGDPLTLSYQWLASDGSVLSEAETLDLSPEIVQPTDVVTCKVVANDGELEATAEQSEEIENTLPVVDSVAITPETVQVDTLLSCSFEASDADLEEVTVTYSWTQNGTEVGTESSLQLDAESYSDADVIVCTATVEDGYTGTASGSSEVTIINTAPVIGSTTISPETPYSYDTLTCTANDVTDLEGDDVTITYEWSIDGEVQTETSNMLTGPFLVGALISCSTSPNDGKTDGDSSQAEVTINNTAPVVDSVAVSPGVVYADTLLSCEGVSSDADSEDLTLTYSWANQAGVELGSDATLQLDPETAAVADVITCTVTATDPHDENASNAAAVTVANTEPVVTTEASISGSATTTSTLTCSALFEDLNDGVLSLSYSWSNQAGTALGTAETYTIAASETETGDVLTCTVSGADTQGVAITSSASVTIENTAPVIDSVSLDNSSPTSQDSLTCSVDTSSDLDEDTITYTYAWTVDGAVQSETSNMFSAPLLVGTLIACNVTPNDGKTDGDTASADATVQNTEPAVDSVTLGSGPYYTNDTITATAVLSDVDSEQTLSANYEWHIIDSSAGNIDLMIQTGAVASLDGTQYFDKGDSVYVIVTPNDGEDDGPTLTSVAASIANSVPTTPTVSLSPDPATAGQDDLICSVDVASSDDDGDSVMYTYVWTDDAGTVQQTTSETSATSDTFAAVDTTEGIWTCEVTPYNGVTSSATATVEDSCPTEGDGSAQDCPGLDCAKILSDGYSIGDGNYWIDPDGSGAFEVYCDMTSDGGGWTLIAQGGSGSCSAMVETQSMIESDSCSYLEYNKVQALANLDGNVRLQIGNVSSNFGDWTDTTISTNGLAIYALQTHNGNWHNGTTWSNWSWGCHSALGISWASGWPNMHQGCGTHADVHWTLNPGGNNFFHNVEWTTTVISSTWVKGN